MVDTKKLDPAARYAANAADAGTADALTGFGAIGSLRGAVKTKRLYNTLALIKAQYGVTADAASGGDGPTTVPEALVYVMSQVRHRGFNNLAGDTMATAASVAVGASVAIPTAASVVGAPVAPVVGIAAARATDMVVSKVAEAPTRLYRGARWAYKKAKGTLHVKRKAAADVLVTAYGDQSHEHHAMAKAIVVALLEKEKDAKAYLKAPDLISIMPSTRDALSGMIYDAMKSW